jgi:hypothetical protein
MATLLVGIAALMGLNAAKGKFGQDRSRRSDASNFQSANAEDRTVNLARHFAGEAGHSAYGATLAGHYVDDADAAAAPPNEPAYRPDRQTAAVWSNPYEPPETADGLKRLAVPNEVVAGSYANTRYIAEADEPTDGPAGQPDGTVAGEPYFGWSAVEVGGPWIATTPDCTVCCTECQECKQGRPCNQGATFFWGENFTAEVECESCPKARNSQAAAVIGSGQCLELSAVTPAPSVTTYQVVPVERAQSGRVVSEWLRAPAQGAGVPRRDANPFEVFGPQGDLIRHIVQLHEELGELRGEASLRESVVSIAAENAAMSTQLKAMEGHHKLLEKLVQQTIELERLRAGQAAAEQVAAHRQANSPNPRSLPEATAQQARLDDLRRENAQLRSDLDTIRSQLQAITQSAKEPQAQTANRNPDPDRQ